MRACWLGGLGAGREILSSGVSGVTSSKIELNVTAFRARQSCDLLFETPMGCTIRLETDVILGSWLVNFTALALGRTTLGAFWWWCRC